MNHHPQRPLLEATRNGRDSLWHLGLGIASVAIFGQAAMVVVALFLFGVVGTGDLSASDAFAATPGEVIAFLLSFAAWAWVLALTLRMVHGRHLLALLGDDAWPQFLRILGALAVLQAVLIILPPWSEMTGLQSGLALGTWLPLLPLSLFALTIQVSTEEFIFRGYLQQYVAARFAHPMVWLVLPSILFGVIHYDPGAGQNAWALVLVAALFGLAAGDLTARAGSLGPAIALHLVNNAFALLLVSLDGDLSGLALFKMPYGVTDETEIARLIPVEIAAIGVSWLAARLALRR